ncbi:MAG: hypothetical protein AB7L90_04100 [Hyphomicrobiaceae bacterium]
MIGREDPYAIVAAVRTRPIKTGVDPSTIAGLEAPAWWDWEHDMLHRALVDFRHLGALALAAK